MIRGLIRFIYKQVFAKKIKAKVMPFYAVIDSLHQKLKPGFWFCG
jgi:hypothetical protein